MRSSEIVAEKPKAAFGSMKPALALIPPAFGVHLSMELLWGARKYGKLNWRSQPVRGSTYVSAIGRHLALYEAGENLDPETGLPHLAHVAAGCEILVDAGAAGTLVDDRETSVDVRAAMEVGQRLIAGWPEPRHAVHG